MNDKQKQIRALMGAGFSDKEIVEHFNSLAPVNVDKTFSEQVGQSWDEFTDTPREIWDSIQQGYEEKGVGGAVTRTVEAPLRAAAGVIGLGFDTLGAGVETIDDATGKFGELFLDDLTPAVKQLADSSIGSSIIDGVRYIQGATDNQFSNALEVGTFGIGKAGVKGGQKLASEIKSGVTKKTEGIVKNAKQSADDLGVTEKVTDFFADSTAEKKAYEILQLPTSQTAKYVAKGKTPPAVREFIDNLDELVGAKDYKEVMKRLNTVNIKNMTTVDDIILKNNYSIDNKVLNSLKEEIGKVADNPSIKTSAKKAYQEVLDNYEEFFARKGTITRLEAQELKKQLNDSVRTLYDKAEAGTLTVQEKSEQKALDLVRRDIQRAVEGDDMIIRELNSKYTGIKDAVSAISKRDTKAMNTPELTKFQKLAAPAVEFISSMAGSGSATFVGRRALKTEKSLKKLLRELQEAKKKEAKAHGKKDTSKTPKQSKDSKESKVSKKSVSKSSPNTTKIKDKSQYTKSDKAVIREHNTIVKELKTKEKELKTLLSKKQTKAVKKAITQIKQVIKTLKTKLKNVRIKMEKAGLIAKKGESEKGFVDFGADLKGGKDLISEAKKYKTANEFIEAQDKVYHGTNAKFDEFDNLKINTIEDSGDYIGKGFYFTNNKKAADRYAKQAVNKKGGSENIQEVILDIKKPLIINNKKDIKKLWDSFGGEEQYIELQLENPSKIAEELQKRGYDGLIDNLYGQRAVFDKSQIKTSSQLRKIWEEAHKK